jgi:tRNA-2-methylthio-N6-dimethylallyladenosine synthase
MSTEVADKKVFIKTFGCQMNVYDSERMGEALAADGYVETSEVEDADLVILNTCHIREKAVEKVYSDLGRIRDVRDQRRRAGKETQVTVAGCVAQAEGAEISRRAPVVDLVIGPQSYHRLPELLKHSRETGQRVVETAFPEEEKFQHLDQTRHVRSATAFLTVQEGCDKFCTFCVVPYTRGMEYSRSLAEVETGAEATMADLIRLLARIDGLDRIRYTTSHPRNMSDDLIAVHGEEPKLMPYLHLPVQSGSDRILAAMNRKHTAEEYLRIIERVRAARPDIALSTDMIVGFPGETDQDFNESLDLVKTVGFAQSFSFKYSPRPGTPAANMDDQVPDALKSERLARLQYLLSDQQERFNAGTVGQTVPVLFERRARNDRYVVGRSPYLQLVQAEGAAQMLGRILPVAIRGHGPGSLTGVVTAS